MRALIMSDSHGWEQEVADVIDRHQNEVDAIFHCGDSELFGESDLLKNVSTVRGNCDFDADFPEEVVEEVKGVTFFAAHGHLLNVKMTAMNLVYKGQEVGADIVCFGHTHVPVAFEEQGIIIINPGSMRLPRQVSVGTYVIVEENDGNIEVSFYSLDGKKQDNLSKTFLKK
ncbi:putative phosphoesterase [Evansella vedderi]|uniref:Phosphoesterase n=1 Tax=Evansella vedderi TaxID=38282 RepID=A0ABT9ZZ03_9BACI|nr:metallophosphoesterase [Evansella vedderi]MDQ0256473.1 putative phosphoesterase [Evansella vedderi]